jgi:hypothetical protein
MQGTLQDLVLVPELLCLPLNACMGPRTLYARKRRVRLLLPSQAALAVGGADGRAGSRAGGRSAAAAAAARQQWQQHGAVPLDFWLTASDAHMCRAVGLDVGDYRRFKAAWERADGSSWEKLILDAARTPGSAQLQLAVQDSSVKW